MSTFALAAISAIEWGQSVSASYCGKLFADLGARVIKIEEPSAGDKARSSGPFPNDVPHPEKSGLFLYLNTNKLSVTLNPSNSFGARVLRELIQQTDLLIESNPPQETERLGFDFQSVHTLNPALVMVSISPFGQTGPYRDYKGSDLVNYSVSGNAYNNPGEGVDSVDLPPLKLPVHVADLMSGVAAAAGAMSAIVARNTSGLGQHVDLSQQEALVSVARANLCRYAYTGTVPTRDRTRRKAGSRVLYGCKDGHVCMSLIGEAVWPNLTKMMGNPDWTREEWAQDRSKRADNQEEVNRLIAEWMSQHTVEEVHRVATNEGIPCFPVRTVNGLETDEQLSSRGFFVEIEHPEAGRLRYPGAPYRLSATPWSIRSPAPLLGHHNEYVYCQMLGYTRQDLVKMRQASVI